MSYKTLRKYAYEHHIDVDAEYQRRLTDQAAHHIDFQIGGYPAFFVATEDINRTVIDVYKKDKQVALLCKALPESAVEQFSLRCLLDEMLQSNEIEGVHSTRREVGAAIDAAAEVKEKRNIRLMGIALKYLMINTRQPIELETCHDVRELYDDAILDEVTKADPSNQPDGEIFRKGPVMVNSRRMEVIHQGVLPESKIIDLMEKALAYLNNPDEELLFRIAVFHYLLGYIHPFYDGNGRLNRFISSYMLSEAFEPVLSYRLSYTIKDDIRNYYKAFDECNDPRNRGELTLFVQLFTGLIQRAIDNLIAALENRKTRWDYYNGRLDQMDCGADLRDLYRALVQAELFSEDGASVKALSGQLGKSSNTVRKYLKMIDADRIKVKKIGQEYYYGIDLGFLES